MRRAMRIALSAGDIGARVDWRISWMLQEPWGAGKMRVQWSPVVSAAGA